MALLPHTVNGKITWYESKLPTWTTNAVAIGSSAPEITALQTKTEAARAALVAQEEAQDTAKTKTAALKAAVEAMMVAGSDVIKKVRAKAATDGDTVYELANIPAPATPSPTPPPGTPSNFKVELLGDGSVKSTWKANNPSGMSGVTYQVWRRFGSVGEFTFVGASGLKQYIDSTIPAGTSQVQYQVRGIRPTSAGDWAQFNVNFGVSTSGTMMASVVQTPVEPKLAA